MQSEVFLTCMCEDSRQALFCNICSLEQEPRTKWVNIQMRVHTYYASCHVRDLKPWKITRRHFKIAIKY